jgi:hypothetical protein
MVGRPSAGGRGRLQQLARRAPAFDFAAWLKGVEADESAVAEVIVRQPSYLTTLSQALPMSR